jgi:hypothetical protein
VKNNLPKRPEAVLTVDLPDNDGMRAVSLRRVDNKGSPGGIDPIREDDYLLQRVRQLAAELQVEYGYRIEVRILRLAMTQTRCRQAPDGGR